MGNIFRAGVQKGNFGGQRRLSPNNKFPGIHFNNTRNEGLPQILEIGTEETVLRNTEKRLSRSPSINDVGGSNNATPAVSTSQSHPKDQTINAIHTIGDPVAGEVGFFSLRPI